MYILICDWFEIEASSVFLVSCPNYGQLQKSAVTIHSFNNLNGDGRKASMRCAWDVFRLKHIFQVLNTFDLWSQSREHESRNARTVLIRSAWAGFLEERGANGFAPDVAYRK